MKERSKKNRTGSGLVVLAALLICGALIIGTYKLRQDYNEQKKELDRIEAETKSLEEQNELLEEERQRLLDEGYSDEMARRIAREKLGLVDPDDVIIVPEGEK